MNDLEIYRSFTLPEGAKIKFTCEIDSYKIFIIEENSIWFFCIVELNNVLYFMEKLSNIKEPILQNEYISYFDVNTMTSTLLNFTKVEYSIKVMSALKYFLSQKEIF